MARRRNQEANPFLALVVIIVAAVCDRRLLRGGEALFSEVRARRFSHICNIDQLIPSDRRAQPGRFESRLSRI